MPHISGNISLRQQSLTSQELTLLKAAVALATHPATAKAAWANEDIFAAIFATLRPYVEFNGRLRDLAETVSERDRKLTRSSDEADHLYRMPRAALASSEVSSRYANDVVNGIILHGRIEQTAWKESIQHLALDLAHLKREANATPFSINLAALNTFLNFSTKELELIETAFLLADNNTFHYLLRAMQERRRWVDILQAILGVEEERAWELTSAQGHLIRSRLIEVDPETRAVFPMATFWRQWFSTMFVDADSMVSKLVQPLAPEPNAGAIGRPAKDDEAIILDILERPRNEGTNVLLYGSKSIDKAGTVQALLHNLNPEAKARMLAREVPKPALPSVAYVVQRYLARQEPDSILLIEATDAVLTRVFRGIKHFLFFDAEMADAIDDRAGDEVLLVENPLRTIWLTHDTERLSENNLGRFLYVAPIKPASREERRGALAEALAPLGVRPAFVEQMSHHLRIGQQQIQSAIELVQCLKNPLIEKEPHWQPAGKPFGTTPYVEALVQRAIEHGQTALNRQGREYLHPSPTQYSLEFLNLKGAFTPEQIIESLKRDPQGSILLFGSPGTGKTQLAEHIAVAVDRPIMACRASDILDKYQGESEKAISRIFNEAANSQSVLFIDEADSLLTDRSFAVHGWETSQINEMLQCIERFEGILICATNYVSHMDRASLRRFTFKLEFRDLSEAPVKLWRMFCNEASIDEKAVESKQIETWQDALSMIPFLTPGDFATVQRQCRILGQKLTPEQWLDALGNESRIKKEAWEAQKRRGGDMP